MSNTVLGEPKAAQNLAKPEFIRPADVRRTHGVSRSRVYNWIKSGRLKSILLRERGCVKGTRLLRYEDLTALIEKAAATEEAASASN